MTSKMGLDLARALTKTYKLRPAGRKLDSVQVCVPKSMVEREARSRGLDMEGFVRSYRGRWSFDGFHLRDSPLDGHARRIAAPPAVCLLMAYGKVFRI